MAHTYLKFNFGADEETVQQACQKLNVWKQAFRLDKKLLYKLERDDGAVAETAELTEDAEKSVSADRAKTKAKPKPAKPAEQDSSSSTKSNIVLLIRLYFSTHEKLSEQRWVDRIPSEEPFKSASPQIIHQGQAEFEKTDKQFESLS